MSRIGKILKKGICDFKPFCVKKVKAKTPLLDHKVMKNLKLSLLAMLLLGAVACEKTNGVRPNGNTGPGFSGTMTTDDAANIAAGALSSSSNGIADLAADATLSAANIGSAHPKCGTIRSDTISRKSNAGSPYTYSYNLTYNFQVDCNSGGQPDSLSSNLVYSGSYGGPNMSSTNSGSSIFGVSGLLSTDTAFVINGVYKRAGSFASKADTANHGADNINLTITNLTLKKPGRFIESGSATISITGSTPKQSAFSYTGTVVFKSNGTATLTLNGTVYNINLNTGWLQRT